MSNGNGASVTKLAATVLGGVITTALISIAAFTFATSKNVAVLSENYKSVSDRVIELKRTQETDSQRMRDLEHLVGDLRVEMARVHGSQ